MFKEISASSNSISNRSLIHGVGINDSNYIVSPSINGKQIKCKFYQSWKNMMKRCFYKEYHINNPTYKNCTVSKEWIKFSNFKKWMEKQDWKGNHLDKDILIPGNKIYSQENCIFVSQEVNTLLLDCKNKRGDYPIGVSFNKNNNKFTAQCNVNGKLKYLGSFCTPEEASKTYKKFKRELIIKIADKQEQKIKNGLYRHAELLI